MSALKDKGDFRERPHQPTRYELISKDGKREAVSTSVATLADIAAHLWPGQEQDEERSGKGWDIQVVGADR